MKLSMFTCLEDMSTAWLLIILGNSFCSIAYQTVHQPQILLRMENKAHQETPVALSLCVMVTAVDSVIR